MNPFAPSRFKKNTNREDAKAANKTFIFIMILPSPSKKRYLNAIGQLFNLQKFGIKFGLSKTDNLLKAFGDPHLGRHYIHIGGTNGKGSVAQFIAHILMETGMKVGLYISPHLVRFTERFTINGREISEQAAADIIEEMGRHFSTDEPPTFFEATTAMALLYFARKKTDVAIMEVGMGGRLDATNVITPLVSGITNISLEHREYLGNRLLDIAREKAGIIKEGVDVVSAATQPRVIQELEKTAANRKAPFRQVGQDLTYRSTPDGLHYKGPIIHASHLELGLKGIHQARNAAMALGMVERLKAKGYAVSNENIYQGLKKATWPGRMQVVGNDPTILLDGAHNPAAMRALARSLGAVFKYDKMILVLGIMADKDIGALLKGIVPMAHHTIYTRPRYFRAAEPERLKEMAAPLKKPGEVVSNLVDALKKAERMARPNHIIVVCGSLFTVGEALTCFDPVKYRADDV